MMKGTSAQAKRREAANELFRLHNAINIEISQAATMILRGLDIQKTTEEMSRTIITATNGAMERILLQMTAR